MNVTTTQPEICPVCRQPIRKNGNLTITLLSYVVIGTLILLAVFIIKTTSGVNPVTLQAPSVLLAVPDARILSAPGLRGGTSYNSLYNARDLTAERYRKLRVGMTLKDAVKLLHYRGTITQRITRNGKKIEVRHWQNPNGTSISARFEKGRLTEKMQFGLLPESAITSS